jgi:hypothetical protein
MSHPLGIMVTMQQHLTFTIEDDNEVADWRIDEHTKQVGRQGIAAARRTLEACSSMASAA